MSCKLLCIAISSTALIFAGCAGVRAVGGVESTFGSGDHSPPALASPTPTLRADDCDQRMAQVRNISITEGKTRAIEEYEKAIRTGCDGAHIRMILGLALNGNGQHERAAEQLRIAIEKEPKNWAAHWTLAQTLLLELSEFDEGLREVEVSRELDDLDSIGYIYDYYIGRGLEGKGRMKDALVHYRRFARAKSKGNKNDEQYRDTQERIRRIEQMTKPN